MNLDLNTPRYSLVPVLLGSEMLVAFLLSAAFYSGFYASDDISYLASAIAIAEGGTLSGSLGSVRLGVVLPATAVFEVWESVFATIFAFTLHHPLLVWLTFRIGRELRDAATGLVAGLIVAFMPLFYVFSGSLVPDLPLSVWLAVELLVLLHVVKHRDEWARRPRALATLIFVIGLLNGVAYMAKESALIMLLPAALGVALTAPRLFHASVIRRGAILAAGLVTIVLLETLLLRVFVGEWMLRLGVSQNAESVGALSMRVSQQGIWPWDRFAYLGVRLGWFFGSSYWFGVLAMVAYPLLRRTARAERHMAWVLSAFALWPFVYQTIGTANFTTYLPPSIKDRYYAIVLVPVAVMLAGLVTSAHGALRASGRLRAATAFMALSLVVITGWGVAGVARNDRRAGALYRAREVRAFLDALGDAHQRYPELPIVVSHYFSRRTAVLFLDPLPGVRLTPHGLTDLDPESLPGEFLFIVPENPDYIDETRDFLFAGRDAGSLLFTPAGREVYGIPSRRRLELRIDNFAALNDPSAAFLKTKHNPRHGALMYLVRLPGAEARSPEDES